MCIRDSVWTIRHLATCYRQIRDFASALEYYKKVEAIQPEKTDTLKVTVTMQPYLPMCFPNLT